MKKELLVPLEDAEVEIWRQGLGAVSDKIDPKLLMKVIDGCLTAAQREYIGEYYFEGRNMYEIAKSRGVAVSTVSRTIGRARRRIFNALKYCVGR